MCQVQLAAHHTISRNGFGCHFDVIDDLRQYFGEFDDRLNLGSFDILLSSMLVFAQKTDHHMHLDC